MTQIQLRYRFGAKWGHGGSLAPPSKYNAKLSATICTLIASGYSLRKIEAVDGMPTKTTILRWLFEESKFRDNFRDQYARARRIQAECMADELIDIADDSSEDEVFTDDGRRLLNKEFVQRSKLRVETRQWVAIKLLPKVYGTQQEDPEDLTPPAPTKVEIVVQDARKEQS